MNRRSKKITHLSLSNCNNNSYFLFFYFLSHSLRCFGKVANDFPTLHSLTLGPEWEKTVLFVNTIFVLDVIAFFFHLPFFICQSFLLLFLSHLFFFSFHFLIRFSSFFSHSGSSLFCSSEKDRKKASSHSVFSKESHLMGSVILLLLWPMVEKLVHLIV